MTMFATLPVEAGVSPDDATLPRMGLERFAARLARWHRRPRRTYVHDVTPVGQTPGVFVRTAVNLIVVGGPGRSRVATAQPREHGRRTARR